MKYPFFFHFALKGLRVFFISHRFCLPYNTTIATMDVNLESTGTIVAIDDKSSASDSLKFRYLNAESLQAAYSFLHTMGLSLGFKHGSIVVDALLADMFESINTTQQEITIELIHQWIGSLVVANKVSASCLI